jgi:hypothetical protein
MRFQFKKTMALNLLFAFLGFAFNQLALADTPPTAINFHQTVLPILKDSCFACHVPGANTPYTGQDPVMEKKIKKEIGDGLDALTMGDKFPFVDEDPAAKQLKHLEKELSKGFMPPHSQAETGLGLPLSDKNRKMLLSWVAQEQKNLH